MDIRFSHIAMAAALFTAPGLAAAQSGEPGGDIRSLQQKEAGIRAKIAELQSVQPRIIGGVPANPDDFPYLVSLMMAGDGPAVDRHFCGGSIVGDQWVMTAAHCVNWIIGYQEYITIGAGSVDLEAMREYRLDGIWIHPNYSESGYAPDYDYAIVKVDRDFDEAAITVVTAQDNPHINVGDEAWIAGWGIDETNAIQQKMLKARVKVASRQDCNDADSYNGVITSRMICLGYPEGGTDACQGDSGGNAEVTVKGRKRLIGATSWGEGCALPQKFGVYSRLIAVRSWITSIIGQ